MEILHFEDLGDASVISECSLGVNLVIDNIFLCSFRYFTSVYNLKAIRLLLMEILHFEDLGDSGLGGGRAKTIISPNTSGCRLIEI